MQIHNRQRELLKLLLNRSAPVHGTEIARYLGSATRTLRQDIAFINDVFGKEGIQIQSSPSRGYWIEESEKPFLAALISQQADGMIPVNQTQRAIAICFYLLEHDEEYVSMGFLAERFYVSKTTVSNTVKSIHTIIHSSGGLNLSVSSKKGLKIEGQEYDKRNLYSTIFLLFYELENEFINRYIQVIYDEAHRYDRLYEVLMGYFTCHKIMLTNKSLMITTNEVLIAAYRAKHCRYSLEARAGAQRRVELPFDEIEALMDVTFSEQEKEYLSSLAGKKRTYSADDPDKGEVKNQSSSIVEEYYAVVRLKYGLDFNRQQKLTEHINAMLYYHQATKHSDYNARNHMKETHPYAYEIASCMDPVIRKYTDKGLTDSEQNSLTARITTILDSNIRKFNVMILTNESTSLTELLGARLATYFGQLLHVAGIYPLYRMETMEISGEIDFVLATSREKAAVNADIVYISPILDVEDISRVSAYINTHIPSYCGRVGDGRG